MPGANPGRGFGVGGTTELVGNIAKKKVDKKKSFKCKSGFSGWGGGDSVAPLLDARLRYAISFNLKNYKHFDFNNVSKVHPCTLKIKF